MDLEFFYGADAPFVAPYSVPHILYLLVCGVVIWLFIRNRQTIRRNRDRVGRIFLVVILFQQVFLLYGWYAVATGFDLSVSLPFHICRMASLLTKKMVLMDVICYFSIFALVSFFYPMNVYHFAHVSGWSYMINHLVTVLIPIFAIVAYDWRPTWASYRNAVIGFTLYFATALAANALTESGNYFYQTDRPFLRGLPAVWFAAGSYLITVAGFALVPLVYSWVCKWKTAGGLPQIKEQG